MKDQVQVVVLNRIEETIEEIIRFNDDVLGNNNAEKMFINKCEHYFSNFYEYTNDDKQAILENGYEQNPTYKIMIHHD
jgi:hypothetical protein